MIGSLLVTYTERWTMGIRMFIGGVGTLVVVLFFALLRLFVASAGCLLRSLC